MVTLAVIADRWGRFGSWNVEPEPEMTMTDGRTALIERVEKPPSGDLVPGMPTFAAERMVVAIPAPRSPHRWIRDHEALGPR